MIPWTPDRIAALAGGTALCFFLYRFFLGRRRKPSGRGRWETGERE